MTAAFVQNGAFYIRAIKFFQKKKYERANLDYSDQSLRIWVSSLATWVLLL